MKNTGTIFLNELKYSSCINLQFFVDYLITIQLPFRFVPILSIIFFSCNDLNVLSIVLFVTPIISARLADVILGFSIKFSITFFSVLFKPTFKPTFLLFIWSVTSFSKGIVHLI